MIPGNESTSNESTGHLLPIDPFLPPDLQAFASLLDTQPAEAQEAFQFLLATAMHEAGKFELVSVVEMDGQRH